MESNSIEETGIKNKNGDKCCGEKYISEGRVMIGHGEVGLGA